jgi:hypothetical protein
MEHRYGRHGPRAWLRWRQRRYGRPSRLPVPVEPQPTIIRVFVPVSAERIIFIIMEATQDSNEEEKTRTELELVKNQFRVVSGDSDPPLPPVVVKEEKPPKSSVDDNPIANAAGIQAIEDLEEIGHLEEEGKVVSIDRDRVIRRSVGLGRRFINECFPRDSRPVPEEYKKLRGVYSNSYMTYFDKELLEISGGIEYLHSQEEIRIRRFAIQDRNEAPLDYKRSDYKKPYHKRDLAVVRVLQVLEIPLDAAREYLPKMHDLADRYEEYFNNPKDEVIWPRDQDLF